MGSIACLIPHRIFKNSHGANDHHWSHPFKNQEGRFSYLGQLSDEATGLHPDMGVFPHLPHRSGEAV